MSEPKLFTIECTCGAECHTISAESEEQAKEMVVEYNMCSLTGEE